MIPPRLFPRLFALLLALFVASAAHAQAPLQKVRLVLDWAWLPYHAPFLIALDRGYFKDEGLDVEMEQGRGSATSAILVGSGDFDIGHINITNAAQAIGKGLPIKVIAVYQHESSASFIGIKGKVTLTDPQSLEHLRIGSTPGGSDVLGMKIFTTINHIPESSLDIISLNADAKTAALLDGRVDVLSGDSHAYAAIVRGAGKVPVVLALRDLGVPLLGFGFVANDNFLEHHPDAVRRFLIAIKKGFAVAQSDPKAACQFMEAKVHLPGSLATCIDYSEGLWQLSTPASSPTWGEQTPEEWAKLVSTLKEVGELPANANPANFYTNAFVPH
ncbi:MAG TPA: ABC transporter substrate-binding protein [Acetobacteraceae bacterium]|nr:ABC transporter substrate-binding protein [Acetobacteraceae bacterium]